MSVDWVIREVGGAITATQRWGGHVCKLPDGNSKAELSVILRLLTVICLLLLFLSIFLFLPCSDILAHNSYIWVAEL